MLTTGQDSINKDRLNEQDGYKRFGRRVMDSGRRLYNIDSKIIRDIGG